MDRAPPTPGVVFTARRSYDGLDRLDVTRTGRDPLGTALAPTAKLLAEYQRGIRTTDDPDRAARWWSRYLSWYIGDMRASRAERAADWAAIVARGQTAGLTLVCYCARPERCHRSIAVRLLVTESGETLESGGERP